MMLSASILLLFAGALLPRLLGTVPGLSPGRVAGGVVAIALLLVTTQAQSVLSGSVQVTNWAWISSIGLDWALRLDGFSLLFALLVVGIGMLVVVYADYYLAEHEAKARFFGFLLLFMGSMLGLVLAGNLLLMVLFWELTGLSSFLLIGFWRNQQQARQGARLALLVTGAGGLALLGGVLLLGQIVGSYALDDVLASGAQVRAHALYPWVLVLVLAGAFTKSAQFPFHFWLPHAMAAPTPVSAYLHSAAMVKAGIYLLGRLYPVLAGTDLWFWLVSGAGGITLVLGAFVALYRHDLKGLLAYSTISHLGLITLLFGLNRPLAALAAVFHIINHAVFKASLFMSAGIIDHETGTRDMRKLGGLARLLPRTAALAIIAAAAMAGVPLLNGFLSKEMFFAETLELGFSGYLSLVPPLLATLASVFTVAYSARFIHDVFFGEGPRDISLTPHEPPVWMSVPVGLLSVLCLAVGLAPGFVILPLLSVAGSAVLGGELPPFSLAQWHGFNLPLVMSIAALAGGAALYFARRNLFDLHGYHPGEFNGRALTERALLRLTQRAQQLINLIENGSLQRYMLWLVVFAAAAGVAGFAGSPLAGDVVPQEPDLLTALVLAVMAVAAVATVFWHRQRLTAVLAMAVVGLMVTLVFARFSAPDLALTQLLVEVVSLLLLLLALPFFAQHSPAESSGRRRLRDGLLAAAIGTAMGLLAWALLTRPFDSISGYFLNEARPAGGGYNVVNVILVDFRGFDTLGEITVLAIAAIAVLALLQGALPAKESEVARARDGAAPPSLMFRTVVAAVLPLALLVAAFLFLRGHNAPGGGFIAGLVVAIALALNIQATGLTTSLAPLRGRLHLLMSLGLGCALVTGLVSMAFGVPFLTSAHAAPPLPLLGRVELASAMFFDLGVMLVVVGMVLTVLVGIGQASRATTERL